MLLLSILHYVNIVVYYEHDVFPVLSNRGAARGRWSGLFLQINGVRVADLNSFFFFFFYVAGV